MLGFKVYPDGEYLDILYWDFEDSPSHESDWYLYCFHLDRYKYNGTQMELILEDGIGNVELEHTPNQSAFAREVDSFYTEQFKFC